MRARLGIGFAVLAVACSASVHSSGGDAGASGGHAGTTAGGSGGNGGASGAAANGGASGATANGGVSGAAANGGVTSGAGTGGASSGQTGGSGGAGGADGAKNAGGGDAGVPSPRCNNCWLLAESVDWDRFSIFVNDGTQLLWQIDDTNYSITTMGIDGTNRQNFSLPACRFQWRGAQVIDGFLYFGTLYRVPVGFGMGATCEHKWTGTGDLRSYYFDGSRSLFWATVGETGTTDNQHLMRIAYPSFAATDESNPNDMIVRGQDAQALYGYDNPYGGSGDYMILRYDLSTKTNTVLHNLILEGTVLTTDDTFVYYASSTSLIKVPKAAPSNMTKPVVIDGPVNPYRVVLDGDHVHYWTYGDTHFYDMPVAGGTPKDISLGTFHIRGLTWDQTRYYVMVSPGDDGPYNVLRIPK